MSSTFNNPSVVQTTFRQQYTSGLNVGVVQYDTLPTTSTFQCPVNTSDLRQVQEDLVLPATSTATSVQIPSSWTKLTKVTVINFDTYGAVLLVVTDTASNKQFYSLPPNGGLYTYDFWPVSAVAGAGTYGNAPASFALYSQDGNNYAVPSSFPVSVRVILTGYA